MDSRERFERAADTLGDEEASPEFIKLVVAIMVTFLVVVGLLTYYLTFVVFGF